MQNQELAGRPIDIHYSLPKDDEVANQQSADPETSDIDPANSGTVFAQVKNATEPITLEAVTEYFSQFGELKDVRGNKNDPAQFFVEFWDLRACRDGVNKTQGAEFKGGQLITRYAFASTRDKPSVGGPGGPPVGRGGRMSHDYPRSGGYESSRNGPPPRYDRGDDYDRSRYNSSSSSDRGGGGSYYSDRGYDDRDRRPSSRDSYSSRDRYDSDPYSSSSRLPPPSNPMPSGPSTSSLVQAGLNLQAMLGGGAPQQPPMIPQMYQPQLPPQAPPPQQSYYPPPQQYPQHSHAPAPVDSQATVLNQMTQLAEYLKQTQQRPAGVHPHHAQHQLPPQMPHPQPMPPMNGPPPLMMPGPGQYPPPGPVMPQQMGLPPQPMPQPPYQPYYG
eukprot:TRINITY_DN541_c0_g1_i3.p1 TRINITY_DN541_c0_g1~~TRINITY_DN541_c0_g1_i3.p1  ORF type:complete len:387 (-),score=66.02 TRINITY_DN541_c0_g1_i3:943-2103(-)